MVYQGHCFEADFYIISLKGCEMVLGVKWQAQLGDVTWNFQTLSMKFEWAGGTATLQGVNDREKEGLLIMEHIKESQGSSLSQLVSLCCVQSRMGEPGTYFQLTSRAEMENPDITDLLDEFVDIFKN